MDEARLINQEAFARARAEIGGQIARIVGYFREDGVKSVAEIAEAMRAGNAAAMVRPAPEHKGGSIRPDQTLAARRGLASNRLG